MRQASPLATRLARILERQRILVGVAGALPGAPVAPAVDAPVEQAVDVPLVHQPAPYALVGRRLVDHEVGKLLDRRVVVGIPPHLGALGLQLAQHRHAAEEVVVAGAPDVDVVPEVFVGRQLGAEARGARVVGEQELGAKAESGAGFVQRAGQPVCVVFGGRAGRLIHRVADGLVLPAVVFVDLENVGEVVEEGRVAGLELPRVVGAPAEPGQPGERHVETVRVEVRTKLVRIRRDADVSVCLDVGRGLGHVRGDAVLFEHGVGGERVAADRLGAHVEGGVHAQLLPAEAPHLQTDGQVDLLGAVRHVERAVIDAGRRAVRDVEQHVERRAAGRYAEPLTELARKQGVGVQAGLGAGPGRGVGDVHKCDLVEDRVGREERVAAGRPCHGDAAPRAAAHADDQTLVLAARGGQVRVVMRARLGGGKHARPRRRRPHGSPRRRHERQQHTHEGQHAQQHAHGRAWAGRPRQTPQLRTS